jgi:hypothetical protein
MAILYSFDSIIVSFHMSCDRSHEIVRDAMVTGLIKAPRAFLASRAQLKTWGYSEISSPSEKKKIYRLISRALFKPPALHYFRPPVSRAMHGILVYHCSSQLASSTDHWLPQLRIDVLVPLNLTLCVDGDLHNADSSAGKLYLTLCSWHACCYGLWEPSIQTLVL